VRRVFTFKQLEILDALVKQKLIFAARDLGTKKQSLKIEDIIEAVEEMQVYIRIHDKLTSIAALDEAGKEEQCSI
jgi:hypothetical protein